jgi:hypothetical protein
MGITPPDLKLLFKVSFIVIGVIIATFGEIRFVMAGFLYQLGGITFEAIRLVMVQRLLSSAEHKMDPLVSLYYFAPVCAVMNGITSLVLEVPSLTMQQIYDVGLLKLLANAMVAFLLNVSVVFLVSNYHFLRLQSQIFCVHLLTNGDEDWENVVACPHTMWCPEGYPARGNINDVFQNSGDSAPGLWLLHRFSWPSVL